MAKWKKGESGNPAGRPPKKRAYTEILKRAGAKTIPAGKGGRKVARKRIIAELIMQGATTGKVKFPDGTIMELSEKEWLDLVWKVYGQIDGPPRDYKIEGDVKVTGPGVLLPPVDREDEQTDEG